MAFPPESKVQGQFKVDSSHQRELLKHQTENTTGNIYIWIFHMVQNRNVFKRNRFSIDCANHFELKNQLSELRSTENRTEHWFYQLWLVGF